MISTDDPNQNFNEFAKSETVATPPVTEEKKAEEKKPEQKPKEAPKQEIEPRKQLDADETGVIIGRTLDDQYRLARLYFHSGLVPKTFDSVEAVFTGLQFLMQLGVKKPLVALRNVYIVNGIPSLWGDLPLALVRQSGLMKGITETIFDKSGKEIKPSNQNLNEEVFGASCQTIRRERVVGSNEWIETIRETWFTVEDAKKAGLLGEPKKLYGKYLRRMLKMRARTENLKDEFGDVLNGTAIAEYDHHVLPEFEDAIPTTSKPVEGNADKLNKLINEQKEEKDVSATTTVE